MSLAITRRFAGLRGLIGNTPLLAIDYTFKGRARTLYAKAEHLNMTGSVKDRMALYILHEACRRGDLARGALIVEATSGNTGIAFAALGRALGHRVAIFMPDWMSEERKNLIRSYGAEIHQVSRSDGGFLGAISLAEELASAARGSFLPRQFANADNVAAHAWTTGPEIWAQLEIRGLVIDAFAAGVGTGGTVMGVGRCLRSHRPDVRVHPIEPANSPTLTTGHRTGKHRIQGISDEFIPPIVDLDALDDVVAVDDGDAIRMSQRLACDLGLAVGISSGANFLGAALVQDAMGGDAVVATVFPDDNKKYLSTDLMREEPRRSHHVTDAIALTGFRAFKRSCATCCDPEECSVGMTDEAALVGEPMRHCPRGFPRVM